MRFKNKFFLGLCLTAVFCGAFLFSARAAKIKKRDDLYKQVVIFSDVLSVIQDEYVDEPKAKELIYGALKGMLSSLDPYSQFLDPESFEELKKDTEGKYGGLGLEISTKDGFPTVITPMEDTPAWKAQIKPGDRIVKIDNQVTREMSLTDAAKKMRGKPGEAVNLTILREKESKLLEFRIVRAVIKIKAIKETKLLPDKTGYIRIVEFRDNTPLEVNSAIEKLTKSGAESLIIDLRNNPGGSLDSAIKIAERFLEKGKQIVYLRGRVVNQNIDFYSNSAHPVSKLPLAILINEGSASGSEILAGSLQFYKRAVIVGKKSFGKGFVQSVIALRDGSALRMTTSRYYLPDGKEINGIGIKPDIEVDEGKDIKINDDQLLKAAEYLKGNHEKQQK